MRDRDDLEDVMDDPGTSAPPETRFAPEPEDDGPASDGSLVVQWLDSPTPVSRVGRYRPHLRPGRQRQIRLRYSQQEYDTVTQAAHAAGLTATGYVAEAALAAATGTEPPTAEPWCTALTELMDARTQTRRIELNINQAARVLNATGEQPIWFEPALALTERAVTRLDDAATAVADLARRHRPRTPARSPSGPDDTKSSPCLK